MSEREIERHVLVAGGWFFFQAEDGIRDIGVTGVQTCALPISDRPLPAVTLAEVLATSDVPGGVVNVLTGPVADTAPTLAAHMDVNALDLTGAGDLAASLELEIGRAHV